MATDSSLPQNGDGTVGGAVVAADCDSSLFCMCFLSFVLQNCCFRYFAVVCNAVLVAIPFHRMALNGLVWTWEQDGESLRKRDFFLDGGAGLFHGT